VPFPASHTWTSHKCVHTLHIATVAPPVLINSVELSRSGRSPRRATPSESFSRGGASATTSDGQADSGQRGLVVLGDGQADSGQRGLVVLGDGQADSGQRGLVVLSDGQADCGQRDLVVISNEQGKDG